MGKALGLGGAFFKSKDPAALGQWYKKHLGLDVKTTYRGAMFDPATLPNGAFAVWAPFEEDSTYFGSSRQPFMVNLIVDDLDACLDQVQEGGATLAKGVEENEFGRFGWFIDPDGNRVELWQPASRGA